MKHVVKDVGAVVKDVVTLIKDENVNADGQQYNVTKPTDTNLSAMSENPKVEEHADIADSHSSLLATNTSSAKDSSYDIDPRQTNETQLDSTAADKRSDTINLADEKESNRKPTIVDVNDSTTSEQHSRKRRRRRSIQESDSYIDSTLVSATASSTRLCLKQTSTRTLVHLFLTQAWSSMLEIHLTTRSG